MSSIKGSLCTTISIRYCKTLIQNSTPYMQYHIQPRPLPLPQTQVIRSKTLTPVFYIYIVSDIPSKTSDMDPNSDTQATDIYDRDLFIDGHPPPVRSKPPRPRNGSVATPQSAVQAPSESDRAPDRAPIEIEQPRPIAPMTLQAPPSQPPPRLRGGNEDVCRCCNESYMDEICCDCFY